ncbi:MAG: inositol monophosphatase family protein [Pseudomonadota bacterium]
MPERNLVLPDIKKLHELIVDAARRELLPRFAEVTRTLKADGSIVTRADIAMQQTLRERLNAHWPEYRFLGEEMPEAEQRALLESHDTGLWCLDPVDGTSNFAAGVPFFAVSLALINRGEVVLGVVYDPMRDECFSARKGQGAWLNGVRLEYKEFNLPLQRALAAIDFKRLPTSLARRLVERPPYSSQRNFGSVALEWCWLAAGRFHVYLHGRQRVWDYAAGSLILAEAGGRAATLESDTPCGLEFKPCSVVAALDHRLFAEWKHYLSTQ